MQKIIPNLWFDKEAEEAANFYISVFKGGKILDIARYGDSGAEVSGQPKGSVMSVTWEILGHEFVGINGGPVFKFSEAVSFMVQCKDQQEIDYYWEKLLSGGGTEQQCGWLKDKYGLSWQIVPEGMDKFMQGEDPAKVERVSKALFSMVKIDIRKLEEAGKGK